MSACYLHDYTLPSAGAYAQVARPLVDAALQQSGRARLIVNGTSMLPLVRSGDAVWVESVQPDHLRSGDVVVLWRAGVFVTHRLAVIDGAGVYTKGDHCLLFDPPARLHEIVGRVTLIERAGRQIDLTGWCWPRVQQVYGGWLRVVYGRLNGSVCTTIFVARGVHGVAWLVQALLYVLVGALAACSPAGE